MPHPFTIIIPARYASTRLPGKPLLDIAGKPMIQRVYEQAVQAGAERVVVATDDKRIADVVDSFHGTVILTAGEHASGTDRLQEAVRHFDLADDAIVVNVQGDEPLIPPAVIVQVAENLANHPGAAVATLCETLTDEKDFHNPNIVKVVTDREGFALYFSRAAVPWPRDSHDQGLKGFPEGCLPRRHLGIYAYRVSQLNNFVLWEPAPLERIECLEQLRFMYNGCRIHVETARTAVPGGVDTRADLERVTKLVEMQP